MREAPIPENVAKLHAAETKMQELKANMTVLGKEAAAALAAVESQQERLTFQRLVAMVCMLVAYLPLMELKLVFCMVNHFHTVVKVSIIICRLKQKSFIMRELLLFWVTLKLRRVFSFLIFPEICFTPW